MQALLKSSIKNLAFSLCPDTALKLTSIRSRRMIEHQVSDLGLDQLARRVSSITDGTVDRGPFAGMRMDYEALPVHGAPKFVGVYEKELHPFIERMIALAPPTVLDVGSAEGFYAVGMAKRLPQSTIYAADTDPKAVKATLHNARLNGAGGRVKPVGVVKPGQLGRYLKRGSAVIMDCEGAEFSLLNPGVDPILRHCPILVEVHSEFGTPEMIVPKFNDTHSIAVETPRPRQVTAEDELRFGPDAILAFDERTGPKTWLFMEPR